MRSLLAVALAFAPAPAPALAAGEQAKPTVRTGNTGGNSGMAGAVNTTPGSAPGGSLAPAGGLSLTPTTVGGVSAPTLTLNPGGAPNTAAPDAASPQRVATPRTVAPAPLAAPDAAPGVLGAQLDGVADKAAARKDAAPAAGAALGAASRGIDAGLKADAAGAADGASLRGALDKAFDSVTGGRASGVNAITRNAVAGSAQDARGRIDQTLAIARTAPPADAPDHYKSAVKIAEDSLPAAAASAVAKAVKTFARAKAERALPELAAAAYSAAAGGLTGETARLLKGFDKWEGLLGAPGRPLVSNAEMLKSDVRRRLDAASAGARGGSTPAVWFQKRGDSYVAALPGSAVAKVAPLASSFALSPSAVPGAAALAASWRAFAADPRASRGFSEVYKGRLATGATVPGAFVSAARYWLRDVLSSLWRRLLSLFSPSSYDLAAPAGREKLKKDLAAASAVADAGAAVRSALDGAAPTAGNARAALAALQRQAAAHESLRGSGARAAASAIAAYFAAATAGLPDSEPLNPALAELVLGPEGIHRLSARLSSDAAAYVDDRVFAGAGKDVSHVEGARLWVLRGNVRLSADLRSAGAGGFIDVRAPGDETVAARLAELGFATRLSGGVVTASYDADSAATSAASLKALAEDALDAASGTAAAPGGAALRALVAVVSSDRQAAARRARALDGRAPHGRLLGRVTLDGEEYDAVSTGKTSFLRSAGGLPAFAAP